MQMDPLGDARHDRRRLLPPNVRGIPEAELTPRVRDAIMAFMREMDSLRAGIVADPHPPGRSGKTADQDHMLPLLNRRAFVRELTRYIAFTTRY